MSCTKTLRIVCPPIDGNVVWEGIEVYVDDVISVCFSATANGSLQGPATGIELAFALQQSFVGVFSRRVADILYIDGSQLDLCCELGVTNVLLIGQNVPPLEWSIDCCTPSEPKPCPPCRCVDLGCFAPCDRVELPVEAEEDGVYVMTVHIGNALAFEQKVFLVIGTQPVLDLRRIGQLGRFKVNVMGQCFEFQVSQVAST